MLQFSKAVEIIRVETLLPPVDVEVEAGSGELYRVRNLLERIR